MPTLCIHCSPCGLVTCKTAEKCTIQTPNDTEDMKQMFKEGPVAVHSANAKDRSISLHMMKARRVHMSYQSLDQRHTTGWNQGESHTRSVSALQIFDASQHDDSQHDAAEVPQRQTPIDAVPVTSTRPAPYMPALAPEVASNLEQDIPPPPQRCKSGELPIQQIEGIWRRACI